MLTKDMSIGVLDSGVGGLTVLKELRRKLPAENFIFLGDTARAPYGVRSEGEIRKFVEEMLCFFDTQNVKLVVSACNTITTLGMNTLQQTHKFGLLGMSQGEKLAMAASKKKKIGLFATEFTVNSHMHEKTYKAIDSRVQMYGVPCTKFVPLVEAGMFGTPEMAAAIMEYTEEAKKDGVDVVLLGCTHFPFLQQEIQKAMGPYVKVIDPAAETATNVEHYLIEEGLYKMTGTGSTVINFTGDMEKGKKLVAYGMPGEQFSFNKITLG